MPGNVYWRKLFVAVVACGITLAKQRLFIAVVCNFAQYMTTRIETISYADHRSGFCLTRTLMSQFHLTCLTEALKQFSDISKEGVVV
jgi:hypothetical protein